MQRRGAARPSRVPSRYQRPARKGRAAQAATGSAPAAEGRRRFTAARAGAAKRRARHHRDRDRNREQQGRERMAATTGHATQACERARAAEIASIEAGSRQGSAGRAASVTGRRDERPTAADATASPPRRRPGVRSRFPFAALSSLKRRWRSAAKERIDGQAGRHRGLATGPSGSTSGFGSRADEIADLAAPGPRGKVRVNRAKAAQAQPHADGRTTS